MRGGESWVAGFRKVDKIGSDCYCWRGGEGLLV